MTAETKTALAHTRTATLTTSPYRYGSIALDATADTAFANLTTSSTIKDVMALVDALVARTLVTTATTIGGATIGKSTEATGVGSIRDLVTNTAFTASQSALAVVIGGSATGTAATDGDGKITALTFTDDGNDYSLGQVVPVTHSGGGAGAFIVASFA